MPALPPVQADRGSELLGVDGRVGRAPFVQEEKHRRPSKEWQPEVGETQLIFPDPIGALPADGRASHVLTDRLRKLKRETRPRGQQDPLEGLRGKSPVRRPPPLYAASPRASGPCHAGAVRVDLQAAPSTDFPFEYGEVSFMVDSFLLWMGESYGGQWPSVEETLDDLWDDWRAAIRLSGADWEQLHASIGCYNIETDPSGWLFWDTGWGAPHKFHLQALQMLIVFNSDLRDFSSQHACGAGSGFADMISSVLTRQTAVRHSSQGGSADNFRIHFLSLDTRFTRTVLAGTAQEQECDRSAWGGSRAICASVPSLGACCGSPYDGYTISQWPGRVGHFDYGVDVASAGTFADLASPRTTYDTRNGAPASNCGGGANVPDGHRIRMQPGMLQFYGDMADYLLYWARYALTHFRHTGDIAYYDAARALGRHVLNQILYHAGHMTHELGHVWCGGNHCPSNGCFMNHARYRMVCAVRAKLGLYHDDLDLSSDSDGCVVWEGMGCSRSNPGNLASAQQMMCRIGTSASAFVLGQSEPNWSFCMSQCVTQGTSGPLAAGWAAATCANVRITNWAFDHENSMVWEVCGV